MSFPRLLRNRDVTPEWTGAYRDYDLVKELSIALGVVIALALLLTALFSSPDAKPSTIAQWSRTDPTDFLTTAVGELDGQSATATYGPPYNHSGNGQHIAFVHLQKWLGVSHPIDTARDFVLDPLSTVPGDAALHSALRTYRAASPSQQASWTGSYTKALAKVTYAGSAPVLPAGAYGPVQPMMSSLLALAQSGGLDGALLLSGDRFYQIDYTKPLMFMNDGGLLATRATDEHLIGTQWGMMNETGSYPGQVWLWLYTFWYQIEPFKSSANADALIMVIMGVLSLAFICIPFIPGIRDIPRVVPVHRLIWRGHYRTQA